MLIKKHKEIPLVIAPNYINNPRRFWNSVLWRNKKKGGFNLLLMWITGRFLLLTVFLKDLRQLLMGKGLDFINFLRFYFLQSFA